MESKCALLLDKLGWKWEYEPFSVMLDGVNYTPDFYVPERGYVIECRGYDSEKGRQQIQRFAISVIGGFLAIPNRPVKRYQLIGPDVTWDCSLGVTPQNTHLCLCGICEQWVLDIKDCGCNGQLHDFEDLTTAGGEISLGFGWWPSGEWDKRPWRFTLKGRAEERLREILDRVQKILVVSGWACRPVADFRIIRNDLSSKKYSIAIRGSEHFKFILQAALRLACAEDEDVVWEVE